MGQNNPDDDCGCEGQSSIPADRARAVIAFRDGLARLPAHMVDRTVVERARPGRLDDRDHNNPLTSAATGHTTPFASGGVLHLPRQITDETPPYEPPPGPDLGSGTLQDAVRNEVARLENRLRSENQSDEVAPDLSYAEMGNLVGLPHLEMSGRDWRGITLQDSGDATGDDPIKGMDELPSDWPLSEADAIDKWVRDWVHRRRNGEPSIMGDGNAPNARVPASPNENFELIPEEGGDGCRGTQQIRRFKEAGRFTIEFNHWLIGGYTRYAAGSAKTQEDLDEEARYASRQQLVKDGILNKEDVSEPDTITSRANGKRAELLAECMKYSDEMRKSRQTREDIAKAYAEVARDERLPLTLMDPFIRTAIGGFSCPEECELSYDLLGTIFTTGADEGDVRGDCSPEAKIGTEKWTERRGTDKDGNPAYVTIELEQWAVLLRILIEPWWEMDADVAIYCKARSQ